MKIPSQLEKKMINEIREHIMFEARTCSKFGYSTVKNTPKKYMLTEIFSEKTKEVKNLFRNIKNPYFNKFEDPAENYINLINIYSEICDIFESEYGITDIRKYVDFIFEYTGTERRTYE